MTRDKQDSAAIRAGLAVGLAAAAYGVSYGALAVAAGLDIWQTCVMSLLMFTGGSQFALIGVIATGGVSAGPAAIASAAILGIRNGIYGVRVSPIIGAGFWKRIAAAWTTINPATLTLFGGVYEPADFAKPAHRFLDNSGGDVRRMEHHEPDRRPHRRCARGPTPVGSRCRRCGRFCWPVVATTASASNRGGGRRGRSDRDCADTSPAAGLAGVGRRECGDPGRGIQLVRELGTTARSAGPGGHMTWCSR